MTGAQAAAAALSGGQGSGLAGGVGGLVLALGCGPLLARRAAVAVRAAMAQAVLLALVLVGRGLADAAWTELAGAGALAAAGLGVLPRLLRTGPRPGAQPGMQSGAKSGAQSGPEWAAAWTVVAAGLGLVLLGAAAGRQATLLQDLGLQAAGLQRTGLAGAELAGSGLHDTLGLALPVVLLGLLAASLRRNAAVRGAALVSALHGVVLAALGVPGGGAATLAMVAVPTVAALLVAALAGGAAVPGTAKSGDAMSGNGAPAGPEAVAGRTVEVGRPAAGTQA